LVLVLVFGLVFGLSAACASDPPPKPPPPPAPAPPPPPPEPDHPAAWSDVPDFYGTMCPPPAFTLDVPLEKTVGGVVYTVTGSSAARGTPWKGPLVLGVLGAIKDAEWDTRKNLLKAKALFDKAKVNAILMNGDVAETGEISDVARVVSETFGDSRPIFLHSGNSEWTSGFTNAFFEEEKKNPAIFNMNLIRHVDLGGVHLVSLPGWSVRQFVKQGGCHYETKDVDAVRAIIEPIAEKGELVVLSAHGPPRGPDKKSLDRTWDFGNVGDEDLQKLLTDDLVRFGIFGHILEAGGRATADAATHKALKVPMKKGSPKLFVNVGSASSLGVKMLNKKTSRGMAAIVTIDTQKGGTGKVTFLKLR
jgi:Icc-related predicted phosphoesterase